MHVNYYWAYLIVGFYKSKCTTIVSINYAVSRLPPGPGYPQYLLCRILASIPKRLQDYFKVGPVRHAGSLIHAATARIHSFTRLPHRAASA